MSLVYLPLNLEKGPILGAAHWVSGNWSSHKAGTPLSAVGLSLVRVLTCYLLDILLRIGSLSLLTSFSQNIKNVRHRTVETGI
jgi:hypothetical protein